MMKHVALFFVPFALLFSAASAQDGGTVEKFYCETEQVQLANGTILVHTHDGSFEVDALMSDQGGLYFTADAVRCIECRRPVNPRNICECPVR